MDLWFKTFYCLARRPLYRLSSHLTGDVNATVQSTTVVVGQMGQYLNGTLLKWDTFSHGTTLEKKFFREKIFSKNS